MRAIWKGAITFGLVSVPIKLYAATEDHDVHLHQVHDADGGRIRYQRRCEVCGRVVDYEHIDKAFEEGGTTVVLTEDDLSALPEERSREIEVVEFVPSDQIDPIVFDRSYFLEPDKAAVKAYALLRRTSEESERTAIVQFSLRQKTRLGALRSRGKVLMLQSLLWDDEVREADFSVLDTDVRVSANELKMASSLVDNLSTDFAPDKFSDEYQEQLRQLVAAKLEQGDALDTAATFGDESEGGDEGARSGRPDGGPPAQRRGESARSEVRLASRRRSLPPRSPRRRSAAKKAAKKAPAEEGTAAKKSAAKKTDRQEDSRQEGQLTSAEPLAPLGARRTPHARCEVRVWCEVAGRGASVRFGRGPVRRAGGSVGRDRWRPAGTLEQAERCPAGSAYVSSSRCRAPRASTDMPAAAASSTMMSR